MNFINQKKKKEILDQFSRRHGTLHKLMFKDRNVPIGFLVRSEFEQSDENEIDVGVTVAFNLYEYFDIEDDRKTDECLEAKFHSLGDLKYFALMKNLKLNLDKFNEDRPAWVLQYNGEADDKKFKIGVASIVNTIINELMDHVKDLNGNVYYKDHYGNGVLHEYLDVSYQDLTEYIIAKIEKIPKYYKNKKICVFFY